MTDHKGMTDYKGSTTRRSMRTVAFGAAGVLAAGLAMYFTPSSAEEARVIPAPVMDEPAGGGSETATFAGGCFWGVQGVFQHVNGVKKRDVGLCRRLQEYRAVRNGQRWRYGPCGIGQGRVRPE